MMEIIALPDRCHIARFIRQVFLVLLVYIHQQDSLSTAVIWFQKEGVLYF